MDRDEMIERARKWLTEVECWEQVGESEAQRFADFALSERARAWNEAMEAAARPIAECLRRLRATNDVGALSLTNALADLRALRRPVEEQPETKSGEDIHIEPENKTTTRDELVERARTFWYENKRIPGDGRDIYQMAADFALAERARAWNETISVAEAERREWMDGAKRCATQEMRARMVAGADGIEAVILALRRPVEEQSGPAVATQGETSVQTREQPAPDEPAIRAEGGARQLEQPETVALTGAEQRAQAIEATREQASI